MYYFKLFPPTFPFDPYQALKLNTIGGANIAIGVQSLYNTTTGTYNTAIGYHNIIYSIF
jgi:hypothetical protein